MKKILGQQMVSSMLLNYWTKEVRNLLTEATTVAVGAGGADAGAGAPALGSKATK
jgi:hypothetical protein